MKLKQISVFIENSPGRIFEVTEALGEAGINLRALNLVETSDFGVLKLLVSDVSTARRILMQKQIPAKVNEVVAAKIPDRPKSLSSLLRPLLKAQVYVEYMYAFAGLRENDAVMIFRFSDNDQAIRILQDQGVTLLDAEAFGMLESTGAEAVD
ncbi:MAG: amino acid-binding protein [Desulfohalobiaceae bacterium]|nr:amino acid-binding protein [Desulfohalobiaceae bacterium]